MLIRRRTLPYVLLVSPPPCYQQSCVTPLKASAEKGYEDQPQKIKSSRYFGTGVLFLMAFAILVLLAPIMPFHDDWWYLTAPNVDFTWRDLLPGKSFWRPFDALFGGFLGMVPSWFPWANKVAIALAHVLNVWMTDRVLYQLRKNDPIIKEQRFLVLGVVAFSSAGISALVNTDTINQVWCITLGLCGTFLMLKDSRKVYTISTVICFFISLLIKESGVAWLAVAPLLGYIRARDFKVFCYRAFAGAVILGVYFAMRFALRGNMVLSGDEYYAISFEPMKMAYNFVVGTVMGWTAVDGLAFFTSKYILFGITVVLSIAGWLLLMMAAVQSDLRENIRRIFIGLIIILSFVAPHCFFKHFHPAELHLYSVVIGVSLLAGCVKFSKLQCGGVVMGTSCLIILFCIGWVDKITEIYGRSARLRDVMVKIAESGVNVDEPLILVVKDEPLLRCYSVFSQSVIHGLGKNTALRSLNGWRESKAIVVTRKTLPSISDDTKVIHLD